jgi:Elongation factor Tu domain 2
VGFNTVVSSREGVLAIRTKAKRKGKAKHKKTLVSKVAARKKATAVRKTKAIGKKAPKRAPVRRVSSKKDKPAAKVAVEATPASAPAEPEAVRPMPGLAAQPTPPTEPGERIGVVTHYYSHLSVAIMRLESGTLRVGDVIHIRGHTTDFSQKVESLEVNQAPVTEVRPNEEFGLKVAEHAREHDVVFKVGS